MQKSRKPQHTSIGLSHRLLALAQATAREFNALAADHGVADRATVMAGLPRQRLTEMRALYTLHAPPANTRIEAITPRADAVINQRAFKPVASQREA